MKTQINEWSNIHFTRITSSAIVSFILLALASCGKNDTPVPSDRELEIQEWREDLAFLLEEMPKRHVNLFHTVTQTEFEEQVSILDERISDLTYNEFASELMKLTAFISKNGRDGHTGLNPFQPAINFHIFPLVLYHFIDGVFIVNAQDQSLIGKKVVQIGNSTIDQVIEKTKPYISKDNEYSQKQITQTALLISEMLHINGITDDASKTDIILEDGAGKQSSVLLESIEFGNYLSLFPEFIRLGFPESDQPVYVTNLSELFWKTYLDASKSIYFQYNGIYAVNNAGETLSDLSNEMNEMINTQDVERIIIDVRQSEGGDNTTIAPLLDMLKASRLNSEQKIFVLIGRGTFSAAMNFVSSMEKETNALFAGEPTGGAPNHYGDGIDMILPNTQIAIGVSSVYHEDSHAGDTRLALPPDMLIELSSGDYFSGVDPVMDTVVGL